MLILLAAAIAQPGAIRTFGDWSVACDNVRRCEATSLPWSEDGGQESGAEIAIVRTAGPDGTVTVRLIGAKAGTSLNADGAIVARVTGQVDGDAAITGTAAQAVARTLAARAMATTADGQVSLKGLAAALRYIDSQQGRAGTVTALVARGARSATIVPAAPPLPVIRAARIPVARPSAGSAALRARLGAISGCDAGDVTRLADVQLDVYPLGGDRQLALLPCWRGAYQDGSAVFVIARGVPARAAFDVPPVETDRDQTMSMPSFDPATATLSGFAKGRGLADCGIGHSYVWDGARFRLTELVELRTCRGSRNYLRRFAARVVR